MLKILHIATSLADGGVDKYLVNYCSRLTGEFKFDFIVSSADGGQAKEELTNLGCTVYHGRRMRDGILKYYSSMQELMKSKEYDIVHVHTGYKGIIALFIAKRLNIKVRIAHAHTANEPGNFAKQVIRRVSAMFAKSLATDLFACGRDTAKWMWGTSEKSSVWISSNAVSAEEFEFSTASREYVRSKLNLDGKIVVGHVGRFSPEKNHGFLLEVFEQFLVRHSNSILLLVGSGGTESAIRLKADDMGLRDKIVFFGTTKNVSALLNSMDLFILPSLHEGLPLTIVEAQFNGLPIVMSDQVTEEIVINRNVYRLSLNNTKALWAERMSEILYKTDTERGGQVEEDLYINYDIPSQATRLAEKYHEIYDRVNRGVD